MTEQPEFPERWKEFSPELRNALLQVSLGEITTEQAREILGLGQRDED